MTKFAVILFAALAADVRGNLRGPGRDAGAHRSNAFGRSARSAAVRLHARAPLPHQVRYGPLSSRPPSK